MLANRWLSSITSLQGQLQEVSRETSKMLLQKLERAANNTSTAIKLAIVQIARSQVVDKKQESA